MTPGSNGYYLLEIRLENWNVPGACSEATDTLQDHVRERRRSLEEQSKRGFSRTMSTSVDKDSSSKVAISF